MLPMQLYNHMHSQDLNKGSRLRQSSNVRLALSARPRQAHHGDRGGVQRDGLPHPLGGRLRVRPLTWPPAC